VATRNITFNLPEDLIRRAKVYAAQHDTSVNAVVRRLLEEAIPDEDRARAAGERLLEIASQGPYSDVDPGTISRDEIHQR
jgi:plasmid stability protein